MPWFSYHGGHSGQFCRHAKGPLEAVVQRAVELGFTHYGLSEHAPRFRAEDLFPGEEDLGPDGLEELFRDYTAEALTLRDRFAPHQIRVARLPDGLDPDQLNDLELRRLADPILLMPHRKA